jgi:hypothetical protein
MELLSAKLQQKPFWTQALKTISARLDKGFTWEYLSY